MVCMKPMLRNTVMSSYVEDLLGKILLDLTNIYLLASYPQWWANIAQELLYLVAAKCSAHS